MAHTKHRIVLKGRPVKSREIANKFKLTSNAVEDLSKLVREVGPTRIHYKKSASKKVCS